MPALSQLLPSRSQHNHDAPGICYICRARGLTTCIGSPDYMARTRLLCNSSCSNDAQQNDTRNADSRRPQQRLTVGDRLQGLQSVLRRVLPALAPAAAVDAARHADEIRRRRRRHNGVQRRAALVTLIQIESQLRFESTLVPETRRGLACHHGGVWWQIASSLRAPGVKALISRCMWTSSNGNRWRTSLAALSQCDAPTHDSRSSRACST